MAIGLSLPYPLYYDEAERVLPDRPIGSLGLMQVGTGIFAIPVIPASARLWPAATRISPSLGWRPSPC